MSFRHIGAFVPSLGVETEGKPPMSRNDSLGVVVICVEGERKPPMCQNDTLGSLVPFWGVKTKGNIS